jgi:hypothetical protein
MPSIALITSIYGTLDELRDPPVMDGVDDYIAVLDEPRPQGLWRQVIEPRPHISNRLASKIPKCLPHRYTDCDLVVWIDGSATVRNDAAEWAVSQLRDEDNVAQFVHPERVDLGDEAKVSLTMRKYHGLMLDEQANHYRSRGMPQNWGLWATGMMVRRRGIWSARFGDRWLDEQLRWSYQDQVSQPYVLWQLGVRPAQFDGSLWHDPHVHFGGHASDL